MPIPRESPIADAARRRMRYIAGDTGAGAGKASADDEQHAPGWDMAKRINEFLPAWLGGKDAVKKYRKKFRDLDEQTRDEDAPRKPKKDEE